MKRFRFFIQLAATALLTLLIVFQASSTTFAQSGSNNFVPGQLVVKLDPLQGATIDQINATYGTTTLRPLAGAAGIYLLQTPAGADVAAFAETLAADLRLLFAEPNFYHQIVEGVALRKWARAGSDPTVVGQQSAAALLNLPAAHAVSTGANTIVAVLDTGIQLDHLQLVGSFTQARYDFVDNDATPTEDFAHLDANQDGFADGVAGHGTHVAGIVHLVAPAAKIMPLRVLDSNGNGNTFAIAEAIQYAVANQADVINLSLGTAEKSDLLKDVIETVFEQSHVIIVAAAGNENTDRKFWPAVSSYAVAVTSVGQTQQKSAFANFGSWVDIAAPGEAIASAFPTNVFASWSGTSFSTPFISGQFALMRAVNPTFENNNLREILFETATPLSGKLGAGFPNMTASLQSLQSGVNSVAVSSMASEAESTSDEQASAALTNRLFLSVLFR